MELRLSLLKRPPHIPDPGQHVDLRTEGGTWRKGFRAGARHYQGSQAGRPNGVERSEALLSPQRSFDVRLLLHGRGKASSQGEGVFDRLASFPQIPNPRRRPANVLQSEPALSGGGQERALDDGGASLSGRSSSYSTLVPRKSLKV